MYINDLCIFYKVTGKEYDMEQTDKVKEAKRGLNARLLLLAAGIMLVVNAVSSSSRTGLSWLSLADLVIEAQTRPEQGAAEEALEDSGESTPDSSDNTEAVSGESTPGSSDNTEAVSEEGDETVAAENSNETAPETAGQEFDLDHFIEEMNKSGLTARDLRTFGIFYMITAVVELLAGLLCAIFSNRVDKSKITFTAAIILAAWELIFVVYLLLRGGLMLSVLFNSILLPLVLLWSSWQMRKMAKADPERILAVRPRSTPVRKAAEPAPRKSIKERASWTAQEDEEANLPVPADEQDSSSN